MALEHRKVIIQKWVVEELQKHFDKNVVKFDKRIGVEADLDKWRPEIEEIWIQTKDERDQRFSIYFDNEFVCSFSLMQTPQQIEVLLLQGLYDLINSDKVYLDIHEYRIQEELRKQEAKDKKDAEIKLKEELKKEHPLVQQAVDDLAKGKLTSKEKHLAKELENETAR